MALTLNPEKALIFRIVHRNNLPWILDCGLHAPNGQKFDQNHRNIGNPDLIGKRTRRIVTVGPGGTLSDYGMRADGDSYGEIAEELGRSKGDIYRVCMALGCSPRVGA